MKSLAIRTLLPFLAWFPLINRVSLRADFLAGLTGAVIAKSRRTVPREI